MRWMPLSLGTVLAHALWFASSLSAQGLLWSLPADGAWIRYEGDYTQVVQRGNEAAVNLKWTRYITIRSVGKQDAEYQGVNQPCRWIEIKVETGDASGGVLDTGPGGLRMFKLLVPEQAIRGTVFEPVPKGKEIFAAFIPVAKGYRKLGDEEPQEITSGVFDLYPVVSLLRHYPDLKPVGNPESMQLAMTAVNAQLYRGAIAVERTNYRSENNAELYRCSELPFGVARWNVTVQISEKATTDPRADFESTVTLREVMQAAEVGTDAESELLIN
jgi:hypothetical protein